MFRDVSPQGRVFLRLLFVCTGNTCRSPMAEAICRHVASQKLGCSEENLHRHNFDVFSGGVAASDSQPASYHAIQALKERGIDLTHHLSQSVTDEMLGHSDLVLAMTASHLNILQNARPDLAGRMRLVSPNGHSISDPIGGSAEDYRQCADEITTCLESLLNDLLEKDTESK